jgi:hypothetical protein
MPNYNKGKIYKITSIHTDKCYVGSTCQTYLSSRLNGHNNAYKSYLKSDVCSIRSIDIIKLGDYRIELLELVPCTMKAELLIKERWWVDKLDCVNKNIPGQTTKGIKQYKKQYYIDNSEKIKQYQIDNSEKIKQYQKQYKIDNPEKIKKNNIK